MPRRDLRITLRAWVEGDLPLHERLLGDPAMTEHLGGPESPEQLRERHARYLALSDAPDAVLAVEADRFAAT